MTKPLTVIEKTPYYSPAVIDIFLNFIARAKMKNEK